MNAETIYQTNMGRVKEMYIQFLEETFNDDDQLREYIERQQKSDQQAWEQWCKDVEENSRKIMIRDFINNFVDPLDLELFWQILLKNNSDAKINNIMVSRYLFQILGKVQEEKSNKAKDKSE